MTAIDFIQSFAEQINLLADRRLLTWQWLLDGSYNKYSRLHARIHGALVRSVDASYIPLVEVKWNRSFRPDVCVADDQERDIGVIEYQSTNSSDERLTYNVDSFERAIFAYKPTPEKLPRWWLLLTAAQRRSSFSTDRIGV